MRTLLGSSAQIRAIGMYKRHIGCGRGWTMYKTKPNQTRKLITRRSIRSTAQIRTVDKYHLLHFDCLRTLLGLSAQIRAIVMYKRHIGCGRGWTMYKTKQNQTRKLITRRSIRSTAQIRTVDKYRLLHFDCLQTLLGSSAQIRAIGMDKRHIGFSASLVAVAGGQCTKQNKTKHVN